MTGRALISDWLPSADAARSLVFPPALTAFIGILGTTDPYRMRVCFPRRRHTSTLHRKKPHRKAGLPIRRTFSVTARSKTVLAPTRRPERSQPLYHTTPPW